MPALNMNAPDLNFGFAWDTESKRLYIVHGNGQAHEQIAADIMSPELAQRLAETWLMGYRSRAREDKREIGKKYHHMLAEAGATGIKFG